MKVGFDIDGVFAQFIPEYAHLAIQMDGRDLFEPEDKVNPPCWHFPEHRGYSAETMKAVWKDIASSVTVWNYLKPYEENVAALASCIHDIEQKHDVYFITDRPGATAKRQTESWIKRHLDYNGVYVRPTVILCKPKGAASQALSLDVYLDDNLDNVLDVQKCNANTRVYLLNKNYNQGDCEKAVRVNSVQEMLIAEALCEL